METIAILLLTVVFPICAVTAWVLGPKWLETRADRTAEKAAQYAAKTERLEQRVAVLERIVTDRSAALGDEIEKLRDEPLN